MTIEEDRKKDLEKHKTIYEQTDIVLEKFQGDLINEIYKHKISCANLGKTRESVQKAKIALDEFPTINLQQIKEEDWQEYKKVVDRDEEQLNLYFNIHKDFVTYIRPTSHLIESTDSSANASASGTSNVAIFLSDISTDPNYTEKLLILGLDDTLDSNIAFIKSELKNIKPDIVSAFDSIIQDWYSKSSQKYEVLLNLRSIIFHQFLDEVAQQSYYSKAPWFKKSSNTKLRFCQVKFLILGYNDEPRIPDSSLNDINFKASYLSSLFSDLSEYGKKGNASDAVIEKTFRETITYFKAALELRRSFYV